MIEGKKLVATLSEVKQVKNSKNPQSFLGRSQINIKKLQNKKKWMKQTKKPTIGGFFHICIVIFKLLC